MHLENVPNLLLDISLVFYTYKIYKVKKPTKLNLKQLSGFCRPLNKTKKYILRVCTAIPLVETHFTSAILMFNVFM